MDSMTIYKHDYFLNQPKDHHILYVIFEIGAFLAKCQCMHNEWCWWAYNIAQDRLCNLFPSTIHVPSKPVPSLVCLFSCTRQGWQHPDQIHILHIPAEKFAVHIPTHSTPHTSRLRVPLWLVCFRFPPPLIDWDLISTARIVARATYVMWDMIRENQLQMMQYRY